MEIRSTPPLKTPTPGEAISARLHGLIHGPREGPPEVVEHPAPRLPASGHAVQPRLHVRRERVVDVPARGG